jgi:hypothetical protein
VLLLAKNLRHMTPLSSSMFTVTPSMRELRHVVTIVDYKILGVMDDVRWNESHKCLHMGFEASVRATSPMVTAEQRGFSPGLKGPLVLGCEPGLRFRD